MIACKQELLDSQLVALAEAEQSMSQLVAATKEGVAAAQKLCHARRELLINAKNRWSPLHGPCLSQLKPSCGESVARTSLRP